MPRQSPTVRLRRLSLEIRDLRARAGLTAVEAARRAGWTQPALSRAENRVWREPDVDAVARLLDVYGVTESTQPERRAALLRLAREAKGRGWWADYQVADGYWTAPAILEARCSVPTGW